MANIADIKKQYPELDALNDSQVVDALHQSFYADLPREQIASALGVKPPAEPVKPRGLGGLAKDMSISAARGIIGLPEAAVGIADLVSNGQAGKLAQSAGIRFKDAKDLLAEYYTPQQKAANAAVNDAKGFFPTVGVMLENPSTIASQAIESAPSMLLGGGVSRGVLALAPRVGAVAAGAVGEAGVSAGQNAEQVRQEDPNGVLTPKQSAILAASGLLTGGVSLGAGSVANKLGIGDIQTMLASGKFGPVGAEAVASGVKKGLLKRVGEGAATEGILQELPQSYQEQVAQNLGQGKPWDEGAAAAGAQGMLAGGLMGGAANIVGGHASKSQGGLPQPDLDSVAPAAPPPPPAGPLTRAAQTIAPAIPAAPALTAEQIDAEIARLDAQAAQETQLSQQNQPDQGVPLDPAPAPQAIENAASPEQPAGPTGQFSSGQEAQDYISAQRRAASINLPPALPIEFPDNSHGIATAGSPDFAEAQRQANSRRLIAGGVQEGDLLNPKNEPFKTSLAARRTAKTEGGEVIAVAGGFVVRRNEAINGPAPAQDRADVAGINGNSGAAHTEAINAAMTKAKPVQDAAAVVLQNRDRSSTASISQMNEIASNPDYLRAGQSSVMDSGAPVVFGEIPETALVGKTQLIADGKGDRTSVKYAVVEASSLIASHQADGTAVASYANGEPGKLRVVAGNGRTAGIVEGYNRKTADTYKQDLIADAQPLGVDAQRIAGMQAPVLVRVMDSKDVTADMGDRSNISSAARLSSVEQAATDARRLSIETLEFNEDGTPTQAALVNFVNAMPTSEQSELVGPGGAPTKQAIDRIMAAAFKQAYGSDELVSLYAQAQDPEARTIMSALADAAGAMSSLKDSGEYDIRGAIAEAAGFAVNARRQGQKLSDMLKTRDMTMSDEAFVIAQFMADNVRSAKKISEGLRSVADFAAEQHRITRDNKTQGGMFGETPTANREDIFRKINGNKEIPQNSIRDTAGTQGAERGAVQPASEQPNGQEVARVAPNPGNAPQPVQGQDPGLTAPSRQDILDQQGRAAAAEKDNAKADKDAETKARAERIAKEIAARQSASADNFQLGQSAEDSLAGQGSVFDAPAEQGLSADKTDHGTAMFSRKTDPAAQNALKSLSQNDNLFSLAKSDKITVEGIAADTDKAIKVKKEKDAAGRTVYTFTMADGKTATMSVRPFNPYATEEAPTLYGYTLKDGEISGLVTERPGENPEDVPPVDDVWVDVSGLKTGSGGLKIYNIAETYAHNTGRIFIGDPAGLTDDALRRRTEQMLSSALKFGTTRHLAPHPRQVEGEKSLGIPPLKWTYGDDLGNIEALIHASLASYNHVNPLTFEPSTGRFLDSEGHELDRDAIRQIADSGPWREAGAGRTTLQRGAVFNALVREGGEPGSAGKLRAGLLERLVELTRQHGASTKGLFYSRSVGSAAGLPASQVQSIVDRIASRWANAPEIIVAASMSDKAIPQAVRDYDQKQKSQGASGDPEGFVYGGKVYVVADQLATPADVMRVLLHESLGHMGLRGVFGNSLKPILKQIAAMRAGDVRAKAKQYGIDMNTEAGRMEAAEEVLAEMAQTRPELGYVKRAIAAIRNWLRSHGFAKLAMTDADILQGIILPARRHIEEGQLKAAGRLAFSRGKNESVTNPNDVVGNQGGRSADDLTPGALIDESTGLALNSDGTVTVYHHTSAANAQAIRQTGTLKAQAEPDVYVTTHRETDTGYGDTAVPIRVRPEQLSIDDEFQDGRKDFRLNVGKPGGSIKVSVANESAAPESGGAPAFSRPAVAGYTQIATDKLNETFNHPGKLNWWHKSFGTMNNLAERSPEFKPVFQAAQGFIDDTSYYATEAAEMAPNILPKLEKWADLTKSPITAADNKAVSAPIFEGTLSWARDESGKAVSLDDLEARYAKLDDETKARMLLKKRVVTEDQLKRWQASPLDIYAGAVRNRFETAFLTPGVVWTDAELKSQFNLTPEQTKLYREFRATVDKSLDNLAKSDLLRFGGKDVEHLKDMVMDAKDADEAAVLLRDYLHSQLDLLPERADELNASASGMMERADKVNKLKDNGYAPLSRFGKYTVDVVVNGKRQYFSLFETERESNKMAAKMRMEYGAQAVGQGTLSESEFKLFAGITPESLELFGNMLGLDATGDAASDKAFQTYLKLTKSNRSAMRRMIHRKGIAGFSEDAGRVLSSFVYSNARQTSAALNMGALGEAVNNIPKNQGELKDAAIALADYIKNPQEEAQAIRGLLFAQYLGGSIASAFVNMTQPFAVTFPWLSQYGGAKQSGAQLLRAMKDMASASTVYAPDLAKALKMAEEKGTVAPQEVQQLMAQARGAGTLKSGDGTRTGDALATASNAFSKLSLGWGKVFSMAEQLNRRSTFIAAYRVAQAQNMKDPAAFAERAVNETQFIYTKANKMKFGRGAIGGTLMTFKSYTISYLELLHRMYTQGGPEGKKAVVLALAVMMLMGGSGGLPFMEDATDLIDGLLQRLGYNVSSKKAKQQFLEDIFGKAGADFVDRGISGLPGMPLDVTGRLGMGNIIPGTGLFQSKISHASDLGELVGPVGDLAKRAFDAGGKLLGGDVSGAAMAISPLAVRNAAKGADMASTGMYRDAKGYKVLDTTMLEAALKSIGFQPESVANVQEANFINQKAKNFYTQTASEIRARWAKGIFEQDKDQVDAARAMMADWNEKNPEQPIRPNLASILKRVREMKKTKDQRISDTAPKAMRAAMRRDLADQP